MKTTKKLGLYCLAFMFAVTTCIFTGCDNKDKNKISVNEVTHSIFYAPLYIAINNGYFENEGLSITLTNGGGSDASMSSLLNNSADIILAGPETVVYTNQEGVKDSPVVIGQLTHCDGSFIVSKTENEDFSLSDLVGETIIGGRKGGLPAMTLQYIIESNGYKIGTGENEINLRTDVAFNLVASVWEADKTVKYCTLFEPTATTIENEGKGKIVASLGELSGSVPYTCFACKKSFLKNNKEQAEKFLKAIEKAEEFIFSSTNQEIAKSLIKSFDGNTLQELESAVSQYKSINAWSKDLTLSEESFNNLTKILLNAKVITTASNWSDIVDNSLANNLKTA